MAVVSTQSNAANGFGSAEKRTAEGKIQMNTKIRMKQITAVALLVVATAINFVGCGDSASDAKSRSKTNDTATPTVQIDQVPANEVQIVIENFAFVPSEITIAAGTKVTWINKDEAPHTATSTDKKFNSGGLDTDDRFSFVFNDKGEFPYFCALHPHMMATVTVK